MREGRSCADSGAGPLRNRKLQQQHCMENLILTNFDKKRFKNILLMK
jgi:hypothetical protein